MDGPNIDTFVMQGTNQLDKLTYGLSYVGYNLTGLCNPDLLGNEEGEIGGFSIGNDGQDFEIILPVRPSGHASTQLDLNNDHIKECFSSLGTLEFTLPSLVIGQNNFATYTTLNNLQVKTRAPERKEITNEETGEPELVINENPGSVDAIICNPQTNLTIIQRPGIEYFYTPPDEEWPPELDPETHVYSVKGQLLSKFSMNEISSYATTLKGDILTTISVDEINCNHFFANQISGSIGEIVNTGIDRLLENGIRNDRGTINKTVYTESVNNKRAVFYNSYLDIDSCHLNTTWYHGDDGILSQGNATIYKSVLNGGEIIANHVDIAESNVEGLNFVSGNSIAFEGFIDTKNDDNIESNWFLSTAKKSFAPLGVAGTVGPEHNLFYSKFTGKYNIRFGMTVRYCNGFLDEAIVEGKDISIDQQESLYQVFLPINPFSGSDRERLREDAMRPSTLSIYDLFGVCDKLPKTKNVHGIYLEGEAYNSGTEQIPFNVKQDIDQFINVSIVGSPSYTVAGNSELFSSQSPQVAMIDPGSTIIAKNIFLRMVRNYGTIICTGEFKPASVANFGTIKLRKFSGPGEGTLAEQLDASFGLANHNGIVQLIDDEGNVIEDISDQVPKNLLFNNLYT